MGRRNNKCIVIDEEDSQALMNKTQPSLMCYGGETTSGHPYTDINILDLGKSFLLCPSNTS